MYGSQSILDVTIFNIRFHLEFLFRCIGKLTSPAVSFVASVYDDCKEKDSLGCTEICSPETPVQFSKLLSPFLCSLLWSTYCFATDRCQNTAKCMNMWAKKAELDWCLKLSALLFHPPYSWKTKQTAGRREKHARTSMHSRAYYL